MRFARSLKPIQQNRFSLRLVPIVVLLLAALPCAAQVIPGHHLPVGPERPVREREVDITGIRADLRIDLMSATVAGSLEVTFTPLRHDLKSLTLDASELTVEKVEGVVPPGGTRFTLEDRTLRITLPATLNPGESGAVRITYSCHPRTGMYFIPARGKSGAQSWNYGEGGLHYAWLPLFNDTNDRFTATFMITVAKPYTALANGRLEETRSNPDGTQTFRWVQDKPIPNYLLTVDVGDFTRVPLDTALVGGRRIPLTAWGAPGTEAALRNTFGDTPKMVEFFSERFGYPYPWDKYDQVILQEFGGAMETTTLVGFSGGHLQQPGDPPDVFPDPAARFPTFTRGDVISHELSHHWFGDLVTCRSLGSLWLNESFGTFAQTVWNGHAHGEDDLTYQRWLYLDAYLDYVRRSGTVRPLEYKRYGAPAETYEENTTYLKGALVLHMLRHFVGDADFYPTLAGYLQRHQFGEVEASDLLDAFRNSTGKNLTWFFDDWIVAGGGHPSFAVSYRWVPDRGQVDLTVQQVQADLPFENDFRLPVEIEVVTAFGSRTHTIEVAGWTTQVALPAESKPLAVIFDKGGWLVAEVTFNRSVAELNSVIAKGGLAEQLRAARQIAQDWPRRPEAVSALANLLADEKVHWGLRQEAAMGLGSAGGDEAAAALVRAIADPDRRIRRAAAVAMGKGAGAREVEEALRKAIVEDDAEEVAAAAMASLGRRRSPGAREVLMKQLSRDSRWWDVLRIGALTGLADLEDVSLAPTFAGYTDARFNSDLRRKALAGWLRAAPEDPRLPSTLRGLTRDSNRSIQLASMEMLATLHRREDIVFFRELARHPDPNIATAAGAAADQIEAFVRER